MGEEEGVLRKIKQTEEKFYTGETMPQVTIRVSAYGSERSERDPRGKRTTES